MTPCCNAARRPVTEGIVSVNSLTSLMKQQMHDVSLLSSWHSDVIDNCAYQVLN